MAYEYGAKEPEKLKIKDMTPKEKELLLDSDTFCMMPWLHIHAFPDGRAYPCCFANTLLAILIKAQWQKFSTTMK